MDEKLIAFVNENVDYYERVWRKKYSWNWAAFFLAFYWMGYRKMYKHIILFNLVYLITDLIWFNFVPNFDLASGGTALIVGIFIGFNGNNMYKTKVEKALERVSDLKLNYSDEIKALSSKGGRSKVGVFIGLGIYLVFNFIYEAIIKYI